MNNGQCFEVNLKHVVIQVLAEFIRKLDMFELRKEARGVACLDRIHLSWSLGV